MGQLWCNTNHPYFVIGWSSHSYWWLSQSQCNDRCQHFKNSRTVEAPQLQFLINSLAFSRIVFQTRACPSVKMLGSGSCSTWSSCCLAAGCIPRRPPTSRNLGLTPFRTLSRSRTFCVVSRHARHTCNSRNFREVVCKTQHTRHIFLWPPPLRPYC